MQPSNPDPAHRLHRLIMELVRVIGVLHPEQVVPGQAGSVSQAFAIHELDTDPPLSQQDLADRLQLEKSTVSRLVAQLRRRGLVERERDPDDPRRYRLRLTAEGRARHTNLASGFHDQYDRWVQAMTPAEREALMTGLSGFLRAVHSDHDPRRGSQAPTPTRGDAP